MKFLGRLRHPVQQKNPNLVSETLSKIRTEVEELGFVLTSDVEEGATYFTAEPGIGIDQSNILQKVVLAERRGNQIAKRLNVQFDFAITSN